jgi:hypothetical protein
MFRRRRRVPGVRRPGTRPGSRRDPRPGEREGKPVSAVGDPPGLSDRRARRASEVAQSLAARPLHRARRSRSKGSRPFPQWIAGVLVIASEREPRVQAREEHSSIFRRSPCRTCNDGLPKRHEPTCPSKRRRLWPPSRKRDNQRPSPASRATGTILGIACGRSGQPRDRISIRGKIGRASSHVQERE